MATGSDLKTSVEAIFKSKWTTRKGLVVPEPEDIKHSNEAVELDPATVLYADLSQSTALVNEKKWEFAADIYKSFLLCAATLIRDEGGKITSYDGDRVMGIWIGNKQCDDAVRCALKINYAVQEILTPAMKLGWTTDYKPIQVVGVDKSSIRATRTGVRKYNDIVWVGRAANYAAKLTTIKRDERTFITKSVYDSLTRDLKISSGGTNMWNSYTWNTQDSHPIYGSTYWWRI